MQYRVAYDVLDDWSLPGPAYSGLAFLGFALFWTAFVALLGRMRRPGPRGGVRGMIVAGGFFIAVGVWLAATWTYPAWAEQSQCRQWVRAGAFETAEGEISHFDPATRSGGRFKPHTDFRVGDASFRYRVGSIEQGGFQGQFTAPWAQDLQLKDGLPVRIAHRGGRILRLETGVSAPQDGGQ